MMTLNNVSEIEIIEGGRVDYSIGWGGSSMFELRPDQQIVVTVNKDGTLMAEIMTIDKSRLHNAAQPLLRSECNDINQG